MRTTHDQASALGDQALFVLPRRETLALLDPGLGIIDLGPMTGGQTSGGGLLPLGDPSGGALPTGGAPATGGAPTTGLDVPTTSLPGKLF